MDITPLARRPVLSMTQKTYISGEMHASICPAAGLVRDEPESFLTELSMTANKWMTFDHQNWLYETLPLAKRTEMDHAPLIGV